jgi:hypothetical protein
MISEHLTDWLGFPVQLFDAARSEEGVTDYSGTIYRLALDWDATVDFPTLFSRFLESPASAQLPAIIIGQFHGDDPEKTSEEAVQLLVSARARLPNLRGIFIGEMISEENEISWINQSDVSPLLPAYPKLEHLRLRGAHCLSLGGRLTHQMLKSLTIETGGLPPALLHEAAASRLPALEHLELWLGTTSYGGDATVEDIKPFLQRGLFPQLKHLGLRDSEIVDEIAAALAGAPILEQLESLDLSLGTLSDQGGRAFLNNPALRRLKTLASPFGADPKRRRRYAPADVRASRPRRRPCHGPRSPRKTLDAASDSKHATESAIAGPRIEAQPRGSRVCPVPRFRDRSGSVDGRPKYLQREMWDVPARQRAGEPRTRTDAASSPDPSRQTGTPRTPPQTNLAARVPAPSVG